MHKPIFKVLLAANVLLLLPFSTVAQSTYGQGTYGSDLYGRQGVLDRLPNLLPNTGGGWLMLASSVLALTIGFIVYRRTRRRQQLAS